jgi:serine/threonine-protein kinase
LAVLLVAAVAVALVEFGRADRERPAPTVAAPARTESTTTTSSSTPAPPLTTASTEPPTSVVIGATCAPLGSTATTATGASGATAYCATLAGTATTVWSLTPGEVPSPTITTEATDAPLPTEEESPVRVCMQQTGQTRLRCLEDIRRSNARR